MKTLTIQTEPPKTPFEVAAEIVRTAQTKGTRAGFSALFDGHSGRLKNIGTAFGTKLLHFGAYKEVSGDARPLIYDKNSCKGWSREPGMSRSSTRTRASVPTTSPTASGAKRWPRPRAPPRPWWSTAFTGSAAGVDVSPRRRSPGGRSATM